MWTKKSATLLCTGIALLLFAPILENYLLVNIGVVFISFVIINTFFNIRQSRVSIKRNISEEKIFENNIIDVEVTIKNNGRSLPFLEIKDYIPRQMNVINGSNHIFTSLKRGQEIILKYTIQCPVHGHYHLGPTLLRLHDAFGLFYKEKSIEEFTSYSIFPSLEAIEEIPIKHNYPRIFQGALTVREIGTGTEFHSIRGYLPGDSFKKINWKAFARQRKLMVNEYEREDICDIMIILDARAISLRGETVPLDRGIRAAAAIANYFLYRKDRVALTIYNDKIETIQPESGERQLFAILSALAGVEPKGNLSFKSVADFTIPHFTPRSPVFFISTLENDDTIKESVRDMMVQRLDLVVLSPQPGDKKENLENKVAKLERDNLILELSGFGARVVDWYPGLSTGGALLGARL